MKKDASLLNYIYRSLKGAWELAKLNPKGMDYFDLSAEGFWRSFWAIAVVAPFFLLWLLIIQKMTQDNGIGAPFLSEAVGFFIGLPFFAIFMGIFTRFLKIDSFYAPMIIAYNWMSVIIYGFVLPITLLSLPSPISSDIAKTVYVLGFGYLHIVVLWFLFKTSLRISGFLAAGVLIFSLLLTNSLTAVLVRLLNPEYLELVQQAMKATG